MKHEGKLIDYNDFGKIIDFIEKKEEEKEITVTPDMIEEIREVFLVFDDQVRIKISHYSELGSRKQTKLKYRL